MVGDKSDKYSEDEPGGLPRRQFSILGAAAVGGSVPPVRTAWARRDSDPVTTQREFYGREVLPHVHR